MDNRPICYHWHDGRRACTRTATARLLAPDGWQSGPQYCREHADSIAASYRDKLGQNWRVVDCGEFGKLLEDTDTTT